MLGCLLGGGGVGSSLLRCLQPDNKEGLVRASPRPDDERATSLEGGGFQDDRVISPPGGVPAGGSPLMGTELMSLQLQSSLPLVAFSPPLKQRARAFNGSIWLPKY